MQRVYTLYFFLIYKKHVLLLRYIRLALLTYYNLNSVYTNIILYFYGSLQPSIGGFFMVAIHLSFPILARMIMYDFFHLTSIY